MYSYKSVLPHAKARLEYVNASYKDLCAVCDNIRYLSAQDAVQFLVLVSKMLIPVYYRHWNKKLGSRRELKGKKGRYPQKAAKYVLKTLRSALANAEEKGLDITTLVVAHAAANKKTSYPRLAPKGRRMRADLTFSRIEIVLEERPELVRLNKKEKTKVADVQNVQNVQNKKTDHIEEGAGSHVSKGQKTEKKDSASDNQQTQ